MNMTRRGFFTTAALSAAGAARATEQSGMRTRLLGAWRLLEAVTVFATGATGPWYDRPGPYTGLIIYDASGAMSVQIASARPAAQGPRAFADMTPAGQLGYLHTYYAYFGRFDLSAAAEVRHFVDSSLDPTEVGRTYTQKLSLTKDRLTLATQPWRVGREWRHSRLEWTRA